MVRDFEREYDDYVDDYYDRQADAAREDWNHEMAEPREEHDDGDVADDEGAPPPPMSDPVRHVVAGSEDDPPPHEPESTHPEDMLFLRTYAHALRRHGYQVIPPDPNAGPLTTRNAPDTSRQAAAVAAVTGGTVEAHLLALLEAGGWTCDEIEAVTGRRHGSLSGAMNRLKRKGLVRESGQTRPTRGGVQAAVYVRTEIDPIWRGSDA